MSAALLRLVAALAEDSIVGVSAKPSTDVSAVLLVTRVGGVKAGPTSAGASCCCVH